MIQTKQLPVGYVPLTLIWALLLTVVSSQAPAQSETEKDPAPPIERNFGWRQTETSLALLNHGQAVWQHVHDRKMGKPFVRFGLLDGTELTRPCPLPTGYPKADHTWHRALWWSFKAIDGVNYWEQHQQGTDPVDVKTTSNDDGSARIEMRIEYHLPGEEPVVREQRSVSITAPDAAGAYLIDWQATFTPAGDKDVVFNRNSYGGFALRMAAECCGDAALGVPAWTFLDSEGRANCNGQTARWVVYRGTTPGGQEAALAIFDHPDNPRHPSWWQSRNHYPYLNPSFTCKEDYTLPAGGKLTLRYGTLVTPGAITPEQLEGRWQAFASRAR